MPLKVTAKKWKIIGSPGCSFTSPVNSLAIPAPILTILANRGIIGPIEIKHFLSPSFEQLPAPQLLMGLNQAVGILVEARLRRTPVVIYGDYDADGVTATALLVKFFREIDLPVSHFIPDRMNDGYGLNSDSLILLRNLPDIAGHPSPILLTVDCGITSIAEVAAARALGFRVIITDHHLPGPELPAAEAIINPQQSGCAFPFRELAGVGVAFFLAAGLRKELIDSGIWLESAPPNLKKYLDLVAIGTVADMVPLRGVNRILVKGGLEVINQSPSLGVKALISQNDSKLSKITSETIAFYLAPKLNAAGRIGSAEEALQLLLADSEESACGLADFLGQANQVRKDLTENMYNEARIQAEKQHVEGRLVCIVAGDNWHQGIVGLVASRLVKEYSRPAVAFSFEKEGLLRGSIRSIAKIDIHNCLQECADILEKFGGHHQAAGLTLRVENYDEFQARFSDSIGKAMSHAEVEDILEIDMAANPNEITSASVLKYLSLLEPSGNGNQGPIFCCHPNGIRLLHAKKVGTGSMRFKVAGNGGEIKGIGFGLAEWVSHAERHPVSIAYRICRSDYRGEESWEIRVEDIKEVS